MIGKEHEGREARSRPKPQSAGAVDSHTALLTRTGLLLVSLNVSIPKWSPGRMRRASWSALGVRMTLHHN